MHSRTLTTILKMLDLAGQVVLLVCLARAPQAAGFHLIPPKLYPLPLWQMASYLVHLPVKAGWKAREARRAWPFLWLSAALLTPFAFIPAVGLLAILILVFLWPVTILMHWAISGAELVRLVGGK